MMLCIAGKNNIAVDVTKYILENRQKYSNFELVCAFNKTDTGVDTWQKSFKNFCRENNIPEKSLEDLYEVENLVFLSLEYDRLIKPEKFKTKNLINIHFSKLLEYKGMYTSILPILHNKGYSGVTLHKIRKGIDTGEIIAQKHIDIEYNDNAYDLYKKKIYNGTKLVIENIDSILSGTFSFKPQSKINSTYFSRSSINFTDLKVDFNSTALQIHNQVRAFSFRPYQLLKYNDVGLIDCQILDEVSDLKPGTVIDESEICFKVATIDYNAIIYKDVLDKLLILIAEKGNDLAKKYCESVKIINAQNSLGETPLITAIKNNNLEMVEFLLEKGAFFDLPDYKNITPLMYARECCKTYNDNSIYNLIVSKNN